MGLITEMCPLSSLPCFSCPILGACWTLQLEVVAGQSRLPPPGLVSVLAPHPTLQVAAKGHNTWRQQLQLCWTCAAVGGKEATALQPGNDTSL